MLLRRVQTDAMNIATMLKEQEFRVVFEYFLFDCKCPSTTAFYTEIFHIS